MQQEEASIIMVPPPPPHHDNRMEKLRVIEETGIACEDPAEMAHRQCRLRRTRPSTGVWLVHGLLLFVVVVMIKMGYEDLIKHFSAPTGLRSTTLHARALAAEASLSISEIILEYICPGLGLICANWMFMAPYQDVRKAAAIGSLGDLNPTPWAVMLGNTLGWVSYGLLRWNWFIFFGNAPGFLLSVYFNVTAIKLLYKASWEESSSANTTNNMLGALVSAPLNQEATCETEAPSPSLALTDPLSSGALVTPPPAPVTDSPTSINTPKTDHDATKIIIPSAARRLQFHEGLILFMIMLWMGVLSCIIAARDWDNDIRQMIVGSVVNCNLVFFYGAPLSIIRQVLTTRSSRWLHGPTMLRNTANGIFWGAYGFAVLDWYVAIPNTLGALLGGIQMLLWAVFPRQVPTPPISDEVEIGTTPKLSNGNYPVKTALLASTVVAAVASAPAASAWTMPRFRTLSPRHCRRHQISPLFLAPQQLGNFESLKVDAMAVPERVVRLESYLDPLVPYSEGLARQQELWQFHSERLKEDPTSNAFGTGTGCDTVIMLQHEAVFTLGTASDESFIHGNEDSAIPVERINRGGEVTYHGPGQLTVYPILDLRHYNQDIHWYMRALEEVVIRALEKVGIEDAVRDEDTTGVWVENHKVAAVGVHARRWITQHGMAINVTPESLAPFSKIVPCGLHGRCVGSVQQFCPEKRVSVEDLAAAVTEAFEETFKVQLEKVSPSCV